MLLNGKVRAQRGQKIQVVTDYLFALHVAIVRGLVDREILGVYGGVFFFRERFSLLFFLAIIKPHHVEF